MDDKFSAVFYLVVFLIVLIHKVFSKDTEKVFSKDTEEEREFDEEKGEDVMHEEVQDEVVYEKIEQEGETIGEEIVIAKRDKRPHRIKSTLRNMILSKEILSKKFNF